MVMASRMEHNDHTSIASTSVG